MLLQDSFLFSLSEKDMNARIQIPNCSVIMESEIGPITLSHNCTNSVIRIVEDRGPECPRRFPAASVPTLQSLLPIKSLESLGFGI